MKKLFLYVFLGLFFCNVGYAKVLNFKCTRMVSVVPNTNFEKRTYNDDLMFLRIDLEKKEFLEFNDVAKRFDNVWRITEITEFQYISGELTKESSAEEDVYSAARFNRYTGEYESWLNEDSRYNSYACEPTKQLY